MDWERSEFAYAVFQFGSGTSNGRLLRIRSFDVRESIDQYPGIDMDCAAFEIECASWGRRFRGNRASNADESTVARRSRMRPEARGNSRKVRALRLTNEGVKPGMLPALACLVVGGAWSCAASNDAGLPCQLTRTDSSGSVQPILGKDLPAGALVVSGTVECTGGLCVRDPQPPADPDSPVWGYCSRACEPTSCQSADPERPLTCQSLGENPVLMPGACESEAPCSSALCVTAR